MFRLVTTFLAVMLLLSVHSLQVVAEYAAIRYVHSLAQVTGWLVEMTAYIQSMFLKEDVKAQRWKD